MSTNNSSDSKTKIFVDLSKSLLPSNLSSNILNASSSKFHFNGAYTNQSLFSSKGFTFNAQTHVCNNVSSLTASNDNGYFGAIKRISTSPRSTSSFKSNSSYSTTSSYHTTVSGSLSTNTAGSSSNSWASTRSVSSLTSGFTYYTNNSNSSSTIHCEDSNNGSNMSPFSSSSCNESRNSCSSSSNDEEETAKKSKKKHYHNDHHNLSTDTSSCSTYLLSSDSMSTSTSANSSPDISTCTSRTTRTSAKSSSSISPSLKPKEKIKTDLTETENKLKCRWNKCKFIGKSLDKEDLTKHLKEKHINTQRNSRQLKCLWVSCKSFNQPSVSFSWLERHVIDHVDTKPIACIMTGCTKKFRTNDDLDKHVQSHLNNMSCANASANSPYASPQKISNQDLLKKTVAAVKIMQESQTKENKKVPKSTDSTNLEKTNNKNGPEKTKNGVKIETSEKAATNGLVDSNKLPDCFAHVRKVLTKRRKTQTNNSQIKKFKKVQYEDFIDNASAKIIGQHLEKLKYEDGTITFDYNILGFDRFDEKELVLIEWVPKNIVKTEWIDKTILVERIRQMTKMSVDELKNLNFVNPNIPNMFYNRLRFRPNRRK